MQKSFSDGQGIFVLLRTVNYIFSRIYDPPEKHENPPWTTPPEIQEPWDHGQMIERKIPFRIALTRALYDQIRPYFFQKYVSKFDPPSTVFFWEI